VADQTGTVRFGLDVNSGRYGGLKVDFGQFTMVQCVHINSVLEKILGQHERIDILKIDTEGTEIDTIAAIDEKYLSKIGKIYIEAEPKINLHPEFFQRKQYGTVCQLTNKSVGERAQ
jgi:FkbM family methyltransferase